MYLLTIHPQCATLLLDHDQQNIQTIRLVTVICTENRHVVFEFLAFLGVEITQNFCKYTHT